MGTDTIEYVLDNAIVPRSVFESIEMLDSDSRKALAYRTLILNGLTDSFNLTEDNMVNIILTMARPHQVSSTQRYNRSLENGRRGGRPKEVSRKVIIDLKEKGYTQNQIATELGCSVRSISRSLRNDNSIDSEIKSSDNDGPKGHNNNHGNSHIHNNHSHDNQNPDNNDGDDYELPLFTVYGGTLPDNM